MKKQDQLADVCNAFSIWRATRINSAVKTPGELRQQAVALLDYYPRSTITSTLHISGSNLKRWCDEATQIPVSSSFIELAPVDHKPIESLELTLNFNGDAQLHLSGRLSPALLTAIIVGLPL